MTEAQLTELKRSGVKYRKELLMMVFAGLAKILPHMTIRRGIRGEEVVGEGSVDAELRPYRTKKDANPGLTIIPRSIYTYHGDVVIEEDPHLLAETIWGNSLDTDRKNADIVKEVAFMMAGNVGNTLRKALFTAVRNPAGQKTADLFNGFSTILNKEISDGTVAESLGNFADLGRIDVYNVIDKLQEFYQDAVSEELQDEENGKLYLPKKLYNLYNRAYQNEFGHAPFNKEYRKTFLEGSDDNCELVPLSPMKDTGHIIMSVKRNMLIGCDQMSQLERVIIRECDNPKVMQFFMEAFFGVQFETISPERFCAAKAEIIGLNEMDEEDGGDD